eukprot:1160125-Pelagomonas_calceolata.AAC.10
MNENNGPKAPDGLQELEMGSSLSPSEEFPLQRSGSSRKQVGLLFSSSSRLSTAADERKALYSKICLHCRSSTCRWASLSL